MKEESSSSKQKLEIAAGAINDLKQMLVEMKEEYAKLADEKKANEVAFESKLNEKGNHGFLFIIFVGHQIIVGFFR